MPRGCHFTIPRRPRVPGARVAWGLGVPLSLAQTLLVAGSLATPPCLAPLLLTPPPPPPPLSSPPPTPPFAHQTSLLVVKNMSRLVEASSSVMLPASWSTQPLPGAPLPTSLYRPPTMGAFPNHHPLLHFSRAGPRYIM